MQFQQVNCSSFCQTGLSSAFVPQKRIVSYRKQTKVFAQQQKYDYVVVGGGASGCVLANRLSQDPNKSVLLLEAGPDPTNDDIVKIPAALTRLFKNKKYDWNLYTDLQKKLNDREIYLARGRMLGGSTCSNATLYMRGTKQDYDDWKVPNWGANDVLDWFKLSEDNANFENEFHGKGGEYKVEAPRYHHPLQDVFFNACKELNIVSNDDFNNWSRPQTGFGDFQMTTDNGERGHTYRQYLQSIMLERPNLYIQSGATATKLLIEQSSTKKVAQGVEYTLDRNFGPRFTVGLKSNGEVIVAAGAIHSPHLLMNSGLGPKKYLDEFEIKSVQDLPGVGQNLQDQPACLTAHRLDESAGPSVTDELLDFKGGINKGAVVNYQIRKRGPLASVGCERGALLDLDGSGRPNVQVRFVPGLALDSDGVQSYHLIGQQNELQQRIPVGVTFQILALKAKSRGTVGLKSNSPLDKPNININYLDNEQDLKSLVDGLKYTRKLMETSPFKNINVAENFPGSSVQSDKDWSDYVRKSIHSGNALVGTCKMGSQEDPNSVVLSDLKVKGVENLRVACSSVIPIIPAGQTGAPTIMIADKAASIIKNQATSSGQEAQTKQPQLSQV